MLNALIGAGNGQDKRPKVEQSAQPGAISVVGDKPTRPTDFPVLAYGDS